MRPDIDVTLYRIHRYGRDHAVTELATGRLVLEGTKAQCFRFVGEAFGRAVPEPRLDMIGGAL